jgi:hypothetical protein
MLIGAAVAFLFIFGLFLSMLSASPRPYREDEFTADADHGQDLLTSGQNALIS